MTYIDEAKKDKRDMTSPERPFFRFAQMKEAGWSPVRVISGDYNGGRPIRW